MTRKTELLSSKKIVSTSELLAIDPLAILRDNVELILNELGVFLAENGMTPDIGTFLLKTEYDPYGVVFSFRMQADTEVDDFVEAVQDLTVEPEKKKGRHRGE